ncbi:unnamed protein product [marine sediment metagenome]|uniref:Uncharacterized protein n=1 Tax=marine sediment metagenome TaxID=412755 RepID=X1TUE8_9ZZZZ
MAAPTDLNDRIALAEGWWLVYVRSRVCDQSSDQSQWHGEQHESPLPDWQLVQPHQEGVYNRLYAHHEHVEGQDSEDDKDALPPFGFGLSLVGWHWSVLLFVQASKGLHVKNAFDVAGACP